VGSNGTANTGGGGGGGALTNAQAFNGGNGGSGIVVLRFPTAQSYVLTGSLTFSTSTVSTDTVVSFTAGTGTITFS
jgi:hypothetical protein